jgi:hypothetical protein
VNGTDVPQRHDEIPSLRAFDLADMDLDGDLHAVFVPARALDDRTRGVRQGDLGDDELVDRVVDQLVRTEPGEVADPLVRIDHAPVGRRDHQAFRRRVQQPPGVDLEWLTSRAGSRVAAADVDRHPSSLR